MEKEIIKEMEQYLFDIFVDEFITSIIERFNPAIIKAMPAEQKQNFLLAIEKEYDIIVHSPLARNVTIDTLNKFKTEYDQFVAQFKE